MPTHPLPYRIHHFLSRQILWSRAVLKELDAFCSLPDDGDFDEAALHLRQRERETRAMAKEYNGLLHEWNRCGDVDAETREAISSHSREAEALLEQVKVRYGEAEGMAEHKKAQNRQALNDLRRGRRSVNIYKPGILEFPGYIDREA